MNGTSQRINFLDAVRGFAAYSVLLQHSMEAFGVVGFHRGEFGGSWLNFGEIGVVAFFLISGFVIPLSLEKTGNIRDFLVNRAFRIYPLYVAVGCVTVLLMAATSGLPKGALGALLLHPFFLQEALRAPNFVAGSWTLLFELVWYLSFALLYAASLHKKCAALALSACVLILSASAVSMIGSHRIPMGRVDFLALFILWLLTYRYFSGDIGARTYALLVAPVVVCIFVGLIVGFGLRPSASDVSPSLRCVLISWTLAFLLFFAPFWTRGLAIWRRGPLPHMGRISYSVYLTHGVVLGAVAAFFPMSGWGAVALIFVLVSGLSTLTYAYVEAPFVALSHALRRRRLSTVAA